MDRDDGLAQRVDLIDAPEVLEALDRALQVADAIGLGLRIESQGAVTLVGILEIPLREQLVGPFTIAGPVGTAAHGDAQGQNRADHHPMTTSRRTFMAASLGNSMLQAIPRGA